MKNTTKKIKYPKKQLAKDEQFLKSYNLLKSCKNNTTKGCLIKLAKQVVEGYVLTMGFGNGDIIDAQSYDEIIEQLSSRLTTSTEWLHILQQKEHLIPDKYDFASEVVARYVIYQNADAIF